VREARGLKNETGNLAAGDPIKGMPDYIKAMTERDRTVAF
jgi:sulfur relay (sulfurtransferase) complex TusBCD TusD component (DsrE family)